MDRPTLFAEVERALNEQPVTDLHTHCYSPRFGASPEPGGLLLWGIDELLTYHYLVAEVYRVVPATELPYEAFWNLSRAEQADHIWKHLFVERTPLSEACRGVLTTLQELGLDPNERDLIRYRKWFAAQDPDRHVDRVMEASNVDSITMTNAVFDDEERRLWLSRPGVGEDPRFRAVLRIDPLLRDWPAAARKLAQWGFGVDEDFSGRTAAETRRFLLEWIHRMKAVYVAVSLPPEFRYPDPGGGARDRVLQEVILPLLADEGVPFAMMIGSRLRVNPGLRDGGDMVGRADVESLTNLLRDFPGNRFLVTMLARENQHELCVAARKFGNLMVFGCWWFLNNPSLMEEVTRMRIELLGTSFIPQHSDARILDQLIYKWKHSRETLIKVLVDKYADLGVAGRPVTLDDIRRDARHFLRDNFRSFAGAS
ncbi:MAG TPA: glucuronate isomerase [Planctomycetota bacterium]|nr:glucuronate isomerase [Planctomycetota bacterium]